MIEFIKKSIVFALILCGFNAFCQDKTQNYITYGGNRNYIFTERTDLRRYDKGKYTGLVSREVSSFISPECKNGDFIYTGLFYVKQQTKRAAYEVNKGINDCIDSVFCISSDGQFEMLEDNGFPGFRNFPSYLSGDINPGDSWKAYSERAVDPLEKGIYTRMPILVQYTYTGDRSFNSEDCYELLAQWATRYGNGAWDGYIDQEGDADLIKASGTHTARIYVSKNTGCALLVSDNVNEMFTYKTGEEVSFKGTISMFTEYPPSVNSEKIETEIAKIKQADSDINFEKTEKGTRLSIHNLQFEPNTAELLKDEYNRIDKIAEFLQKVPEKTKFLIEGHTARVGEEAGEYELSLERAHTIARALMERGISSDRIICKGYGGKVPVADNETPEGRALNRRVEITILE